MKSIITHNGSAHIDEFLAICLLTAKKGAVPIIRRNPTQEELDNPEIWVVDVGGVYDPERNNYDHHQQGGPGKCSLRLVAEALGGNYDEVFQKVYPWYLWVDYRDCKGPIQMAKTLGIEPHQALALASPVEKELLNCFSRYSYLEPWDSLPEIMKAIGEGLINHADKALAALEEWRNFPTLQFRGATVIDGTTGKVTEGSMFGFDLYKAEHPNVAVVITKNPRGGISLTRIDDHPRVDFRRVRSRPEIIFIHQNGFLAVVKEDANVVEILDEAIA
ncbi:MAG: hypothetical protein KatS3mg087_2120 [Patescibacteria group bacterium]|nr:MAG: hypothetical protein KatS3mg087_2120 [Patescibacteria group bacterium]